MIVSLNKCHGNGSFSLPTFTIQLEAHFSKRDLALLATKLYFVFLVEWTRTPMGLRSVHQNFAVSPEEPDFWPYLNFTVSSVNS